MPDDSVMAQHLEEGIVKADSFLQQDCGARRLPDSEARSVADRSFVAGWQILLETPNARRRINVYVDRQFPLSVPHFLLLDVPAFPTWPHVEEDGLLCLDNRKVPKFRQPAEVIGVLLPEAYRLIRDCESGTNENDFRTEFYSYWNRQLSTPDVTVRSLLEPHGPSRLVQIWRGETRPVVGETQHQVLEWLRNLNGNRPQFDSTEYACLLWLAEPLLPRDYPKTGADIYRIASSMPGGKELLRQVAGIGRSPYYFLIGAESGNGPCLAAVRTLTPRSTNIRGKMQDRTQNGFRPGKVPPSLQTRRLFSTDAAGSRLRVDRVDPAWVHGRGHDPRQKELSSKNILLFGCGSIGAPIAVQLAMAGVGNTMLVDPGRLDWANIGRHPLGADHVEQPKAIALARVLQKAYPHARFEGFHTASQQFLLEHSDIVATADIIVCAIADWKGELEFNLRQAVREIRAPILYTWTESNACAGHAVLVFSGGACLQCGFSTTGDSKLLVTEWTQETATAEPACGAIFQPYGPIELLGTISLAAGLVLDALLRKVTAATHRIWAGPENLLLDAGGSWSKEWINNDPDRSKGGFQEERVWQKDPFCDVCGSPEPASRSHLTSGNPSNVSS
jgi:sulfur-carrier protein adenylyltransferase/sulfurtransferase